MIMDNMYAVEVNRESQRYLEMSEIYMNNPKIVLRVAQEKHARGDDVDYLNIIEQVYGIRDMSDEVKETIGRMGLPANISPKFSVYPLATKMNRKDMKDFSVLLKSMVK